MPVRVRSIRDHPRIRGEHLVTCISDAKRAGSSPHTRGARRGSNRPPRYRRIIPAYAGSTGRGGGPRSNPRDHPRIRGEHAALASQAHSIAGSSPHTRGARRLRIIREGNNGDHPRIRGEHRLRVPERLFGNGSSPHTRGALCLAPRNPCRRRIIPAYAGSTGLAGEPAPTFQDHPRIRGEHQCNNNSLEEGTRIIPAYAGSTIITRKAKQ